VAQIRTAIDEAEFLPCSVGYRAGIGAREAGKQLSLWRYDHPIQYVVEADIKGSFDHIRHDQLMEMLTRRIDDKPFLRLIQKWLKAGIFETDGQVIHPVTGTPQGGIVSPILANSYLHDVLDEWFEDVVKRHCRGEAYLIRAADDFVCAFHYLEDAERFYRVLGRRVDKYGLQRAEEKTRLLRISRHHREDQAWFEFLGFEFHWRRSRRGKVLLSKQTSSKKLKKALMNFTAWCQAQRHRRLKDVFDELKAKRRGDYNYYGIRGNSAGLMRFFHRAIRILWKWLNRRSQKRSHTWEGFHDLLEHFQVPQPRIVQ
jgi:RNA-directed DNA polymerase